MAGGAAAGIRRADLQVQVGAGDTDAVVGSPVDHHVGALRHVAVDAEPPRARFALVFLLVEVVTLCVVDIGLVTLQAEVISLL